MKMTKEQREYAVELLKSGWSSQKVAARFGVSRQYVETLPNPYYKAREKTDPEADETIRAIKEEFDTVRAMGQKPRVLPRHADLIRQRYSDGVARTKPFIANYKIAKYLGVGVPTINQYTRRRDIAPIVKKLLKQAVRK